MPSHHPSRVARANELRPKIQRAVDLLGAATVARLTGKGPVLTSACRTAKTGPTPPRRGAGLRLDPDVILLGEVWQRGVLKQALALSGTWR